MEKRILPIVFTATTTFFTTSCNREPVDTNPLEDTAAKEIYLIDIGKMK
jgi:hypothetical protein